MNNELNELTDFELKTILRSLMKTLPNGRGKNNLLNKIVQMQIELKAKKEGKK